MVQLEAVRVKLQGHIVIPATAFVNAAPMLMLAMALRIHVYVKNARNVARLIHV